MYWNLNPGTSGSDSPGQAVEAEEIVKQLDMEQVDEITTSTATSTNGAAYSSQAVQVRSTVNNGLEEVEETNDRDLPPLTGKKHMLALHSHVRAMCDLYSQENPNTCIL